MSDLSESNVRAGKIAVGSGMVDQGTVDRALHLLEARDSQITLGELLLSLGHITPEQVNDALREQAELAGKGIFKNLGELLIAKTVISPDQVKNLLHEQDQYIICLLYTSPSPRDRQKSRM